MPLYEYECANKRCTSFGFGRDEVNSVDERHHGPICIDCMNRMRLVISPVAGVVKFPAAGGREYISPTTGKAITTERARRDDLKRSGCRPYEGLEQEKKEADRWQKAEEKKSDAKLHESVAKAYHQLSPKKRAILKGTA